MAWQHSHTVEAYENARENLYAWSAERLAEALAADQGESVSEYQEKIRTLSALPIDALVDACMEAIDRVNLCDNGGHRFWIDREGYYTVSCSPMDEPEDD